MVESPWWVLTTLTKRSKAVFTHSVRWYHLQGDIKKELTPEKCVVNVAKEMVIDPSILFEPEGQGGKGQIEEEEGLRTTLLSTKASLIPRR